MFEYAWYHADATCSGVGFCFLLSGLRVRPLQGKFREFVHNAATFEDRSATCETAGEGPLYPVVYLNQQDRAHHV